MRVLKIREVIEKTGKSKAEIYQGAARGAFPAPIKLGPKSSGWIEHEIDEWIAARIAARDVVVTNRSSTLTVEQVLEIRNVRDMTCRDLAKRYGVSHQTINSIKRGLTYRGPRKSRSEAQAERREHERSSAREARASA